jgi:hypothetical protein
MPVHDSRILQVTPFEMLQSNLGALDFSLLLLDVMKIAVELGFAADAGDGELHERHGEASSGVALLHCTRSTSRYSATNGNTARFFSWK